MPPPCLLLPWLPFTLASDAGPAAAAGEKKKETKLGMQATKKDRFTDW